MCQNRDVNYETIEHQKESDFKRLTGVQRATFEQMLAVIQKGGWTLEAAEAICENKNAPELLTHLVDKSLFSVDHDHGDEVRYYLLETIRQYGLEKLTQEEICQLRNIRLGYFLLLT